MAIFWFVLCLYVAPGIAQFEGDVCVLNATSNGTGTCTLLNDCPYAIDLLKSKHSPINCGFKNSTPVVCCPEISHVTVLPPGRKSIEKCKQYYPWAYPETEREDDPSEVESKTIQLPPPAIAGGVLSLAMEFPHMAILGYGAKEDVHWLCGGSLISENFILTAAHCVISQDYGHVKWARIGDLDINSTDDDAQPQNFEIVQTFPHPDYKPPSHYHDIALLKLDRPANFTSYVQPICLEVERVVRDAAFTATGWGATEFFGESSTHLMSVKLNPIGREECQKKFSKVSSRKLGNGIVDEMQICAGDVSGKDTCPGDSGGPLQVGSVASGSKIVGITSFGKACGIKRTTGVYTRVSHYVSWIEDVVWPD